MDVCTNLSVFKCTVNTTLCVCERECVCMCAFVCERERVRVRKIQILRESDNVKAKKVNSTETVKCLIVFTY